MFPSNASKISNSQFGVKEIITLPKNNLSLLSPHVYRPMIIST